MKTRRLWSLFLVLASLAVPADGQATGEYESTVNDTGGNSFQINLDTGSANDVTIDTGSVEIGVPDGQGGYTWSDASVACITPNPGGDQTMTFNSSTPVPANAKVRFSWSTTSGTESPFETDDESWEKEGDEDDCPSPGT